MCFTVKDGHGMSDSDSQDKGLPLESVGVRLRRAREVAGLSLADVAARTKIAERHLSSIEQDHFSDLASRTYAVGFARAYARTVGLDESEIAQGVRRELAAEESREAPRAEAFEPGDPARVPGSSIAWIAAIGGVIVIGLIIAFWRSYTSPAVSLPDLTSAEESAPVATQAAPATSAPAPPDASAPVVFTALEPDIWVKFYDAAGTQLMQKQMAKGETYVVPADANGPQIWTARPDALQISVGGRIVPSLAEKPVTIKDRPVSAAALLGRAAAVPAGSATTAAAQPVVAPGPAPAAALAPSPAQNAQ
jgi:cytoskeleton protein RodZ